MQSHIAFWNSFHINTKNVNRFPFKKKSKYLNRKKKKKKDLTASICIHVSGLKVYKLFKSTKKIKNKKNKIETPVKEGTATDEFNSQQLQ